MLEIKRNMCLGKGLLQSFRLCDSNEKQNSRKILKVCELCNE